MLLAIVLSLVVIAYNNVVNRWEPFQRGAYVPTNLVFSSFIAFVAMTFGEIGQAGLGLGDAGIAAWTLVGLGVFAVGAWALARSRHGHRIADKRVEGLHGSALAYHVGIRIPLGTAAAEELIFRGALFAAWLAAGLSTLTAALAASVAFGLWHITPTIIGVRINDPDASGRKIGLMVVGAIVVTTIAGLALTWLRVHSGGLVAPILAHAGVNSIGALAAVKATRHRGRG